MRTTIPRVTRLGLVVGFALASFACQPGNAATQPPRRSANEITRAEIESIQMSNVFDLVSALRPRWLQRRGTDTLGEQGEIRAYIGSTRLSGGLRALRDVPLVGVTRIEFVDPITAGARWGLDHGQGAIVVVTSSR
jgi:hypothetical protein